MPIPQQRFHISRKGTYRRDACAPGLAAAFLLLGLQSAPSGDILRGGAAAPNVTNRTSGASTGAAQAAAARANAKDALARTSRAVESVQRAQQNATRAAAGANNAGADPNHPGQQLPDVPNGLAPGGLQTAPGVGTDLSLWTGAFLPAQTTAGGKTEVVIKQTQQQALLNWQTFNVGKDTHLHFDQSDGKENVGQWTAFNKVNDPSGRPSQILGSITAPGQVYIINQNGIIFGGASQINTHTLVASSLPINDALIKDGLLNQGKTAQFLFSALPQAGTTPFVPPPLPAFGRIGDVTVQAGAQLTAPSNASKVGGRIALVGPNVTNAGSISTPDGQTILAAGLQVGFAAHSSADPSLRGLDVYVGAIKDPASTVPVYAGTATNMGSITTARGSAIMAGKDVRQLAAIDATTSVALNGRIDLLADYDAVSNTNYDPVSRPLVAPYIYGNGPSKTSTGTVTFGNGSITRILPEWGSADKVIGTELSLRSQVNAQGKVIHMEQGSMLHLPNGIVNFDTGVWEFANFSLTPPTNFVRAGGQIYLDGDAMINVAGTPDAYSPLSNHILTVALRSAELADSPLQRSGQLRGPEVTVDLRKTGTYNGRDWVGTPLGDLRGYLNVIERTVDELTAGGGTVNLNSGGSIIMQPSAVVDVSAGWLNYGSGYVKTTRLLYQGNLIDIASATPDRLYDGIFSGLFKDVHPRWSVTRTYRIPWMDGEHYEEGYLQGANAGQLALAGSSMALDGMLRGSAVSGLRQVESPAKGGNLKLNFQIEEIVPGAAGVPVSPTPPAVSFSRNPTQRPAAAFGLDAAGEVLPLRNDRVSDVVLPSGWLGENAFASLSVINPDGNITVPRGITLGAPPSGSITLSGANVSVLGNLEARGGSVNINVYNISPSIAAALKASGSQTLPAVNPDRGLFVLGTGASINTAGLIVDNRPTSVDLSTLPKVVNGGNVNVKAYSAVLSPGSLIDVSGGVEFGPRGERTYGKAGSIEILSGQDLNIAAVDGGTLKLGGRLKGYSGTASGGTLSLQAQLIQIGGSLLSPASVGLDPDFFNQGGFSTFNLTGLGAALGDDQFLPGLWIAPGTKLEPKVKSWLAQPYGGPDGTVALAAYLKPEAFRAPANLNFAAKGIRNELTGFLKVRGDLVLGRGASVVTDALGSIKFEADTIQIYGSAVAPGGKITVTGGSRLAQTGTPPDYAQTTVYLAPGSLLSTAGTVLTQIDRFGRTVGSVLPGGTIGVSGNIVAAAGAVIDVSGTSGWLDLHPHQLGLGADGRALWPGDRLVPYTSGVTSNLYQGLAIPTWLESNGGSITLSGGQMLFADATLLGQAGGPNALGGTLSISSGRFLRSNSAETNLVVTQGGITIPDGFIGTASPIGEPVRNSLGEIIAGMGYFSADAFSRGGFDSLALGGNVEFKGPVNIEADRALRVASGGVIRATGLVNLKADYVSLGQAFVAPLRAADPLVLFTQTDGTTRYNFAPTGGTGQLTVTANLIDVGSLSLQGIGQTTLNARNGDIRGNGTLNVAGKLDLTAGQIYPTTGSAFNVIAYDSPDTPGTISVQGGTARDLPLSAVGELNLFASTIMQGGTLRAPFGTIRLGWDGTGTAPFVDPIAGSTRTLPVSQNVTLAAGSETSVSAIDPRTGLALTIPYGYVNGGESWIDPSGVDITATGPSGRKILIGSRNLTTEAGSQIDIRGGGDLYAYRWVQGNGGSKDVLLGNTSFAILPGYDSMYDPYAAFNPRSDAFGGDPGYVNSTLKVGDAIYLGPNGRVPTGTYTLLPARYALQPGGYLVTPQSGSPIGSFRLPDGSSMVSGYRFNTVDSGTEAMVQSRYELAPDYVVRQRSAFDDYFANSFFRKAAAALNIGVPRLPGDSGRLVLQATLSANLNGSVAAKALAAGRGGAVDISSAADIFIGGGTRTTGPAGSLFLKTEQLNAIGAESLLIGGVRNSSTAGATVAVNTGNLTLDNPGVALSGTDIVLVSRNSLTVGAGASIVSTGAVTGLDNLIFGNAATAGSGNGLMVRMSSDARATSSRLGVTAGGSPVLTVGAGARLEGQSLTLDSTAATSLSPDAALLADGINLYSGQISLVKNYSGPAPATIGLVLAGGALNSLEQRAADLNLSSYTSLDLYGTGSLMVAGSMTLSAGQIRGIGQGGGDFRLNAADIVLDNRGKATLAASASGTSGNLIVTGNTITLGTGDLRADQFDNVQLDAASGLIVSGTGSFSAQNNISGTMPSLSGLGGANHAIRAGGLLNLSGVSGAPAASSGLGAQIALEGSAVRLGTNVVFPSGRITVKAASGDLRVGGVLSAVGTAQRFFDVTRYTDAGEVQLSANGGSINLLAGSLIDVSAQSGGGNAGQFSASAPSGNIVLDGLVRGQAGANGISGLASFDLNTAASLSGVNAALDRGGFFESRLFRVRTGDVLLDGAARARTFRLAADAGSIVVQGSVDASGATGGQIVLSANGTLTLLSSARLNASGADFDAAGKGGSISLQSGSSNNGVVPVGTQLDLQSGSVIDLSVATLVPGSLATPGSSAFYGKFGGTLQLRAPRNAANNNLGIGAIGSTISGASSIQAEGYELIDLTASGVAGTITTAVQTGINTRSTAFMANQAGITSALLGSDAQGLGSIFVLSPGAEIINRTGNLTLGTTTSTSTSDWSLHAFRYGTKSAPGVLSLRASGDLIFYNALSDGFTPLTSGTQGQRLWLGTAMALNPALPANTQSWAFNLTAGADLRGASLGTVLPLSGVSADRGSLLLGKNYPAVLPSVSGENASTATAVSERFQVIRTGTGNISINAARDVRLLNQFASIYTAGARLATPTTIFETNDFNVPLVVRGTEPVTPDLGATQQKYAPTWTMSGGNVGIQAGQNIGRYTLSGGVLIADTSRQVPNNWLYRRGNVNETTGTFGASGVSDGVVFTDSASSTTWWVDFSNFFQGIGTLGGGNISMVAGNDIVNADAVAPTNARMPGRDTAGNPAAPDASKMVELGGGDIRVIAGRNIDGGTYYAERGNIDLNAGGAVKTNQARSPSLGILGGSTTLTASESDIVQSLNPEIYDPLTWMPTNFYLGRGHINVAARRDILLGSVANTFLLPQGLNNKIWYKTYFNTYGSGSSLDAVTLGGSINYRLAVNLPKETASTPVLQAWLKKENLGLVNGLAERAANFQPWIRLVETSVDGFELAASLLPATVRGIAYGGDITVTGDMTLFPSATGTLELLSSGSINGIGATGPTRTINGRFQTYVSSRINLSDANPASIAGITTPFVDRNSVNGTQFDQRTTKVPGFSLSAILNETGSANGSISSKNSLHAAGVLHQNDRSPLLLYGMGRDVSGLTLFSAKASRLIAQRDISDVGLYLQNTAEQDISLVSAGRDLIAYNDSAELRSLATSLEAGNMLTNVNARTVLGGLSNANTGDIQINGPGVLEVLAGGKLDLGTGANLANGTGVGITSIGNQRNPNLPAAGADLIVMAGVGGSVAGTPAEGLSRSALDIEGFTAQYAASAATAESAYLKKLGVASAAELNDEQKAILALEIFFDILKKSGREAATTGTYDTGYAAITALYGNTPAAGGEILGRSRDIRSSNGGAISIAAPGGGLAMASQTFGNPLAPPGIVTESGGSVSIFTKDSVSLGQARIFTLRGGNIIIWSSLGNIAAGSAAKTVVSAPPTRVLIDSNSADVKTDLAGLATGGGIGVLATVAGVAPGDVDLIAPVGAVDAGDAGIRSSGNLTIAAAQVLNASNIAVSGTSVGTPAPAPSAPAVSPPAPPPPPSSNKPANGEKTPVTDAQKNAVSTELPVSDVTVEVLGYGGSDAPPVDDATNLDDEEKKRRRQKEQEDAERKEQDAKVNSEAPAPGLR